MQVAVFVKKAKDEDKKTEAKRKEKLENKGKEIEGEDKSNAVAIPIWDG